MLKFILSLALCVSLTLPILAQDKETNSTIAGDRATELLKRVDDMWRGESSYARMTMRVKTKRYERSLSMEAWSKGSEKSLIKIINPKKEKGVTTLKSGNNIYTYLPKTDRTIKLSSGMMGGSWMGSHFTNDDLVAESRLSEDYDITISFEGDVDGRAVIDLTLIPKEDTAVVWGKLISRIDQETLNPIRHEYYDEDMVLIRKMTYHDIKDLGGRMLPTRMKLKPVEEPDEYTEMVYEQLDLNIGVEESFFSLSRLKKK